MARKKYTYEDVRLFFEEIGFTLLEKEYKHCKIKMKAVCKKGHVSYKSFDNVRNNKTGCLICSGKFKKSIEEVRKEFKKYDYTLVSKEYKDARSKLNVICDKGHQIEICLDKFKNSKRRCGKCYRENNFGENHPNWNSELTDEERLNNRDTTDNKRWREAIFERDDYTCRKCDKKAVTLNAHHIENYSTAKESRFDLNNGVTLCKKCHLNFHRTYGFINNDEWQLKEFLGRDEEWTLISINF